MWAGHCVCTLVYSRAVSCIECMFRAQHRVASHHTVRAPSWGFSWLRANAFSSTDPPLWRTLGTSTCVSGCPSIVCCIQGPLISLTRGCVRLFAVPSGWGNLLAPGADFSWLLPRPNTTPSSPPWTPVRTRPDAVCWLTSRGLTACLCWDRPGLVWLFSWLVGPLWAIFGRQQQGRTTFTTTHTYSPWSCPRATTQHSTSTSAPAWSNVCLYV